METFTISKRMSEHLETLLCDTAPANVPKLLRTIYFDHLFRQHETGLRTNFDNEVLIMDAIFGFFEIADEETKSTDQKSGGDNDYKLN